MRTLIALGFVLAAAPTVWAGPEQQAQIDAGCRASTNWSEAACVCIASVAGEKLSDMQQSYLAATLNEQDVTGYASQMTAPELLDASMFMMKSGPACQ